MKYIIVTGGVISGLGKGITASSIGLLLKEMGMKVTAIKIDPYLNLDAGTMSPFEHGEVYVLDDGTETDLDLGNYERFLDIRLTGAHNITTGKIFYSVFEDERKGKYLGKTVQTIPHVTNKIKDIINETAYIPVDGTEDIPDVCIVELGGTVGDIESLHFIEAIRQMKFQNTDDTFCFIHVSLVSGLGLSTEDKTKPTQNSVKDLRKLGISPDLMVIRCPREIDDKIRDKLSLFCEVPHENIIINPNVNSIYDVPIGFHQQDIEHLIRKKLNIEQSFICHESTFCTGIKKVNSLYKKLFTTRLRIGIVGKYTGLQDSYLSIIRAIEHAAFSHNQLVDLVWISSEDLELEKGDSMDRLRVCQGIVIPGGFGIRGIEGMIKTASYCREQDVPLLGICLGMHIICIEALRKSLGTQNCNSVEFDPATEHPVVFPVEELDTQYMGGTMKLGLKKTVSQDGDILERHRHRYEINPQYINDLKKEGLYFPGTSEDGLCMDICCINKLKFYKGCQYHPEFLSRLDKPGPLFRELVDAIIKED